MNVNVSKVSFFTIIFSLFATSLLIAGVHDVKNPFAPELITAKVDLVGKIPDDITTLIDALSHPLRFKRAGAPMPKGILMLGDPGVGKTQMARLVAQQLGAPIIITSAAQFINKYVGTGAASVRSLFESARQYLKDQEELQRDQLETEWWAKYRKDDQQPRQPMPEFTIELKPVIIFIDEIDSIGCARAGLRAGGGDQELRTTLNQLFTEMEGAKSCDNIVVMAATNEDEGFLDPALSSRFTYIAHIPLPDAFDRLEILRLYGINCTFAAGITLDFLAGDDYTQGYAGRDLKKLVEDIARMAACDKNYADDQVAIAHEHIQEGYRRFHDRKQREWDAKNRGQIKNVARDN